MTRPRLIAVALLALTALCWGEAAAQSSKPVVLHATVQGTPEVPPDAPVITSHGGTASVSLSENLLAVATIEATPSEGTWSLSGDDAALFEFAGTSGGYARLQFIVPPDYETPGDVGGNNVYNVTVSYGNSTPPAAQVVFTITVTDASDETEPVLAAILTQPIAVGGSINVTPTVVQGTGLKYAISSPPTGYNFNTATGNLTGTLSTPGLWKTRITGYLDLDGDDSLDVDEPQDHVTFGVVVYSTLVTMDDAWHAANGPFPITLTNCEHTMFVADEDRDASGTAFIIADNNVYFDGNGHTQHYGGTDDGIGDGVDDAFNTREVCFETYVSGGYLTYPTTISGGAESTNCAVFDYNIVNDGADAKSNAIDGRRGSGFLLADSSVHTDGKDSHTVNFYGGIAYVLNNVLTTDSATTFNRHSGPANVGTPNGALYYVERSALLGGNSGVTTYYNGEVHKNIISHSGDVTNGYGVWMYYASGAAITSNLILPTNGRGILCNGGTNHTITENVILSLEEPNVEFGSALNPPALRARYGTSGITYTGNRSLGIGGTDLTSASTLYVTSSGAGVSNYSNNIGDVILVGNPDLNHYVQPITLEGTANGIDVINGNVFRSNHNQIRVEGYDGYTDQITPLRGNSFDWVDGTDAYTDFMAAVDAKLPTLGLSAEVEAAADTRIAAIDTLIEGHIDGVGLYASRAAWHIKYYSHSGTETSMDVLDSDWNDVDPDSWTIGSSALSAGSVNVREGFTQSVLIKDSNSDPLASVEVIVTSDQGDVTTAMTDSSGYATLTFFRFAIIKANASGEAISVVDRTQSTVSYGGESAVITHASVPADVELE